VVSCLLKIVIVIACNNSVILYSLVPCNTVASMVYAVAQYEFVCQVICLSNAVCRITWISRELTSLLVIPFCICTVLEESFWVQMAYVPFCYLSSIQQYQRTEQHKAPCLCPFFIHQLWWILFTVRRCASAVYAMALCPSVCLTVCHKSVLYLNG